MEYLWIVMLGFAYIIWSISAIKDIVNGIKYLREYSLNFDIEAFECSTCIWFIITIAALFIWSFVLWISR